eukprot:scaffold327_cov257-Pinguiococcus_pyrenoidosus.AAC.22
MQGVRVVGEMLGDCGDVSRSFVKDERKGRNHQSKTDALVIFRLRRLCCWPSRAAGTVLEQTTPGSTFRRSSPDERPAWVGRKGRERGSVGPRYRQADARGKQRTLLAILIPRMAKKPPLEIGIPLCFMQQQEGKGGKGRRCQPERGF